MISASAAVQGAHRDPSIRFPLTGCFKMGAVAVGEPFGAVMGISRCRWRSGLGGNLGASDQNDIAVENGLCNAEEAGHDLRIVVGVHGGLIDEPLIGGEDAGAGLVLRSEEADRIGLVAAD